MKEIKHYIVLPNKGVAYRAIDVLYAGIMCKKTNLKGYLLKRLRPKDIRR